MAQEVEGEYLARLARHEDEAARAYRGVYDDLGLTFAVHDDGTLDASWSLGGEVLQPGTDTMWTWASPNRSGPRRTTSVQGTPVPVLLIGGEG